MQKCELLSPAGNMKMLKYAIAYGADAVYLAGVKFGARKFATNFDDVELKEAIEYAHIYGVKVYLTINTLIYEREIEEFIAYVEYIHKLGVDAVLVQDFGMLKLLSYKFPNLEIHASTQMHNNSKNMLELLKKYGVTRAVLDREMSLEEIRSLPLDIEKEIFCHGALCVSYSGQCLFSSMILSRSGNRGECAGMCRLPYKLEINGKIVSNKPKFYLSLKDLCTVDEIDKILDANINCLKIEGRLKSPQYVGYITKIYRRLIDSYYNGHFEKITEQELKNIKLLFNRGLTKGFVNNESTDCIANINNPNHIGIPLGTYKCYGKKIELQIKEELYQGDTIRFLNVNQGMTINFLYDCYDKLISHSKSNNTVYVDNFLDIKGEGELRKVGSVMLEKEIDNLPVRKIIVSGTIVIKKDTEISLTVFDGTNKAVVKGEIPSSALNKPLTKETVKKQLLKTGNTVYEFKTLNIDLDEQLFVNIKELNELRRHALDNLDELRKKGRSNIQIDDYKVFFKTDQRKVNLNVCISTEEQYVVAKKYATNIFVQDDEFYSKISNNPNVYHKYEEKSVIHGKNKYMISDYGTILTTKTGDVVHTDYMLNVINRYAVENLLNLGANTICLSPELSIKEVCELQTKCKSSFLEVLIYGRIELMKMKYSLYKNDNNDKVYLIDRNNQKYFLKSTNKNHYLMSNKAVDHTQNLIELIDAEIKNFRIDFTNENAEMCEKILSRIHKIIF